MKGALFALLFFDALARIHPKVDQDVRTLFESWAHAEDGRPDCEAAFSHASHEIPLAMLYTADVGLSACACATLKEHSPRSCDSKNPPFKDQRELLVDFEALLEHEVKLHHRNRPDVAKIHELLDPQAPDLSHLPILSELLSPSIWILGDKDRATVDLMTASGHQVARWKLDGVGSARTLALEDAAAQGARLLGPAPNDSVRILVENTISKRDMMIFLKKIGELRPGLKVDIAFVR